MVTSSHAPDQGRQHPSIDGEPTAGSPARDTDGAFDNRHNPARSHRTGRTAALGAHATGVADSGRWSTRRIAVYALFVALTMALSFLEIPLLVPWLKYDPSGIVILVSGFAFGPSAAAVISALGFVPHLFTNPLGAIMAIAVSMALSVPASLAYRNHRTRRGASAALCVGALCALAVAVLGNLAITPLYTGMDIHQVAGLIVPVLLPFNVVKFLIHGVCTFAVYKPISDLLHR